ncbi:hypothetical protein AAH051_15185 [Phocaeicola dorei]
MLVASVIPAMPLPCANVADAANRATAEKRTFFFIINTLIFKLPDGWIVRPAE